MSTSPLKATQWIFLGGVKKRFEELYTSTAIDNAAYNPNFNFFVNRTSTHRS